ncbi:PAS domain-containing protein [Methylocapsa acidiphila]|uniref:PAS domain-containing protein n=1 Tax=Methylocapsa acidiphila TaxID=133552 RepID=UPI0004271ACF|nr:PAS domain-containing protein [Methylocapsa acidiphila]
MDKKQIALIVEDEPLVKDLLVLELEDAGFEVISAENGDEASSLLQKLRRIDLLLTDIRMPGRIDGWLLAEMARRRHSNLPVIYTSAFSPQRGLEVESSRFLPKPYRIAEIFAAIEELQSGRAKLSSVAEEPIASRDEVWPQQKKLDSGDDDLRTENASLKAQLHELSCANRDLVEILNGAQIATIFLDRNLAIKRFSPAANEIFCLVDSDVGRPISQIRPRLRFDLIHEAAERALRTHSSVEHKVESGDGAKRYLMRILPLHTRDEAGDGVIISFVDLTQLLSAERAVHRQLGEFHSRIESLERILDLAPVGILIAGGDPAQPVQANRYAIRLLGERGRRKGPRAVPVPYRLFDHERELAFWEQPLHRAALTGQTVTAFKGRLIRCDGSSADVLISAAPILDETGAPRGAVAAIVDLSERKSAQTSTDLPQSSEQTNDSLDPRTD